jgi:hypothetical protein
MLVLTAGSWFCNPNATWPGKQYRHILVHISVEFVRVYCTVTLRPFQVGIL